MWRANGALSVTFSTLDHLKGQVRPLSVRGGISQQELISRLDSRTLRTCRQRVGPLDFSKLDGRYLLGLIVQSD